MTMPDDKTPDVLFSELITKNLNRKPPRFSSLVETPNDAADQEPPDRPVDHSQGHGLPPSKTVASTAELLAEMLHAEITNRL